MSPLEAWVRSYPGFGEIRQREVDWIQVVGADGREATVGCCWPDAPCIHHRTASPDRIEKFKKGIKEFLNGAG